MATFQEAQAVKKALREQLGLHDWLRNIGIEMEWANSTTEKTSTGRISVDGPLFVLVSVTEITDEVRQLVPSEADGVTVKLEGIGPAGPQNPDPKRFDLTQSGECARLSAWLVSVGSAALSDEITEALLGEKIAMEAKLVTGQVVCIPWWGRHVLRHIGEVVQTLS